MKHLSKSVLLLLALGIAACQQNTQPQTNSALPLKSSPPPANPALCYVSSAVSQHVTYATLAVMDTTAANQTNIYTASSSSESILYPAWSSTGSSICFLDGVGYFGRALKAIDVSVNSNGVPVGSNVRTLYSPALSDSMELYEPRWCQNSLTGKIAFIRLHVSKATDSLTSELCLISQSGGTVTVLDSIKSRIVGSNGIDKDFQFPAWSPDDSKIAVKRQDSSYLLQASIMIFSATSGAPVDSISLHADSLVPVSLQWSHSGMNELAFGEIKNGGPGTSYLYYCAPSTGSTPTTNSVANVGWACWSPNNSSLLTNANFGLYKIVPFTTTSTTILSSFTTSYPVDWKP